MCTITIHSKKPDDLYFIAELAHWLNLKTEIIPDSDYKGIGRVKAVDYEDTKEGILEGIRQGFREVKLAREGKIKLKSLDELLDEYNEK